MGFLFRQSPAGTPDDIFYHLIKQVKARGIKTVLDARGRGCKKVSETGPEIIKPIGMNFKLWEDRLVQRLRPCGVLRK